MNKRKIKIDILCHECKKETNKSLDYLIRRVREGKTFFFCSRNCTDTHHSRSISGENNPNFNGKWYATCPSEWSVEKRLVANKKSSETRIANGTSRGEKNGRWAGGRRPVNCIICSKETTVSPYVYRRIKSGLQVSCCSHECGRSYARSKIVSTRTSIEIKIAEELALRQIEYIEQYNLGNKFSLDFFLPEYNIVIECDGDYWHTLPNVMKRDKAKNAYISACGHSLYRFWENEINTDVEACIDIVMAEINAMEAI